MRELQCPGLRRASLTGPAGVNEIDCCACEDVILQKSECQYQYGEQRMVDLELEQGLAVITIDRPEARNAIAPETMEQLEKALDEAEGAKAW